MLHIAMYDAFELTSHGHPFSVPGIDSLPTTRLRMPAITAASAANHVLDSLFPKHAATFDAQLQAAANSVPPMRRQFSADSFNLGANVAQLVLDWRSNDGSEATVTYQPQSGLGSWQPTLPAYAAAVLPQWGGVTPFALDNAAQFMPSGPPTLDSAAFASAYNEVKTLGSVNSTSRTADQTQIAKFWADNGGTATPPGHWNEIATQVARSEHLPTEKTARLFAELNVAEADAGIACWSSKYTYSFWRPVTAIREGDMLGSPSITSQADWSPLLGTPAFPSYVSGHSTFSAAAATVLSSYFGNQYHFTTTSDALPVVTRSFSSFTQAAEEAGQSRIYGGIHYQFDNQDGLKVGRQIGQLVLAHFA
ncbi:MAG: vanadium-dependent haloperoxidase [Planctomycetes bacterium]|nr:vanadium-dependent haloperoxidase [Planctomycetota bacterium]